MKYTFFIKDPDGVQDGLEDAVKASLGDLPISSNERQELQDRRISDAGDELAAWIEYGEYLRVEIDTDAMTTRVIPRSEWAS